MFRSLFIALVAAALTPALTQAQNIRAGIIGLDTSHAIAFTKLLNAKTPQPPELMGVRVVAAYPQGSKDIESSTKRVPELTQQVKDQGVEIVSSISDLLDKVDVVFLESNDGRPHLEQVLPCLEAGKPTFIDKPIAGTLADAIRIFEAAAKTRTPIFSSSSLRFGKNTQAVRQGSIGKVITADTRSPASLEPTHPDLFWYGIHGVESLFTTMGTGCLSVKRGTTDDGKIQVTGTWDGNRTGIFRESSDTRKGYAGTATNAEGKSAEVGGFDGYQPLLNQIIHFFRTGVAPVTPEETLEIYAFMEAADESKRRNGAEVSLAEVMAKAKKEMAASAQ
ncbi:MAG: Gfo/Idh/MocA family oxidoreductase [Verrucomicrobiaceae bacterium]|nr:Gfo/Idh/MocA family oxidoreductase [Verrucomicrobiaceae bacterium]